MKTYLILIIALSLLTGSVSAQDNKASVTLAAAIYEEEVTGNLDKAVELYMDIIKKYPDDRPVAAKTLYHLGLVNEKMGKQKAGEYFTRLVNTYPDQTELVNLAKAELAALGIGTAARSNEVAIRRIWAAGKQLLICVSPDGGEVVFRALDSGNLWLRNLQSGEQRQITREGSLVEQTFASSGGAAISHDCKWIAYMWWNGSYEELRLSLLDGSSMRILNNGQNGSMYVTAWMPDGSRILAVSQDKNLVYRPHIISLLGGSVSDIDQPEPGSVNWGYPSPDGRYIAYSLNGDIFFYNSETEQHSVVVKNPATDAMVGWTPDGSGIILTSDRSGSRDLYLLAIGNGRPRGELQLLRRNLSDPNWLYLTCDGRLFQIEDKGTWDSYTVSVDEQTGKLTGTPSMVDSGYPRSNFPAWSSDGKLIFYSRYKWTAGNPYQVLVIRSEETGQINEITTEPLKFWSTPILSPNGRQFAVTAIDKDGNYGVFAINRESGSVSQIAITSTANDPIDPYPNWSPDGKVIFYIVRSPEKSDEFIIRRKDLISRDENDLHTGIYYNEMKISPDGTRFVYFRNDKPAKSYVLGILDIQSGKELELWRVPGTDYSGGVNGLTWTSDGKFVLATLNLKQGSELWRFPASGGPGEKLYFFPEFTWGIVMHPNGKRIAFAQSQINYELWVLENFLPK